MNAETDRNFKEATDAADKAFIAKREALKLFEDATQKAKEEYNSAYEKYKNQEIGAQEALKEIMRHAEAIMYFDFCLKEKGGYAELLNNIIEDNNNESSPEEHVNKVLDRVFSNPKNPSASAVNRMNFTKEVIDVKPIMEIAIDVAMENGNYPEKPEPDSKILKRRKILKGGLAAVIVSLLFGAYGGMISHSMNRATNWQDKIRDYVDIPKDIDLLLFPISGMAAMVLMPLTALDLFQGGPGKKIDQSMEEYEKKVKNLGEEKIIEIDNQVREKIISNIVDKVDLLIAKDSDAIER